MTPEEYQQRLTTLDAERDAAMVREWQDGASLRTLAGRWHVNHKRVRAALEAADMSIIDAGRQRIRRARLTALLEDAEKGGMTHAQLAAKHGYTVSSVGTLLSRMRRQS